MHLTIMWSDCSCSFLDAAYSGSNEEIPTKTITIAHPFELTDYIDLSNAYWKIRLYNSR